MVSLLLVVFILQFLLHIINTVGANTINELVRPSPQTLQHSPLIHQILILLTAMDTIQQTSHPDFELCAKGPSPEEGHCSPQARTSQHVASRQLLEVGQA